VSATEAIEAEVAAGDESVAVDLAGETLYVKPVRQWRSSALRALRDGDFEAWAETSLDEESAEAWVDIDPTVEQVEQFFTDWGKLSGQTMGKSSTSRRSSTRTRKR
jgi:hypothetical protein